MSEDKHLEEKEKLEAEIARSLSVVKVKEVHKQIEDVEKLRKQASIKSISERILSLIEICNGLSIGTVEAKKENPHITSDMKIEGNDGAGKMLLTAKTLYDSICFDLQRTIDVKKEDFDRLFPKIELDFTTYGSVAPSLVCLKIQLIDMKNYCLRLL